MNRTIVLLDVDGVLNALTLDVPEGWKRGLFNGYQITWDPTITERLRDLHETGRVEIQWLTTWCEDADKLLAEPMGLPRGLVTHSSFHRARSSLVWWKLLHADDVAKNNPDRNIVWIDDDHGLDYESRNWAAIRDNVLTISPDLYRGLTHEDLDKIEEWISD
jgi:hypothetical protein